jgi:hypothetical protein
LLLDVRYAADSGPIPHRSETSSAKCSPGTHPELEATVAEESATDVA